MSGPRTVRGCGHVTGADVCGITPTSRYLTGDRCIDHTPAALAGRPEIIPDPARAVAGLRSTDDRVVIDMPTVGRVVLR